MGLFDLQVNGFAGVDFQKADLALAELQHAVRALREHETTRILFTLITDDPEALAHKFRQAERLCAEDRELAQTIVGYHLEGPYLSPEPGFRGAHPAEHLRPPDLQEFSRLQKSAGGRIRLLTIAPEWPGSESFIRGAVRSGVRVSLGHSDASADHIDRAITAGATLCTHLGNGCPAQLPRHDNIIQRLLARDELTACFIPDRIHLPPAALRNFSRAKPAGKILLTTDCMAAAGAGPGAYTLGPLALQVGDDGVVRAPGQLTFAGSSLTLEKGVVNFAVFTGVSRSEARELASCRVAEALGFPP